MKRERFARQEVARSRINIIDRAISQGGKTVEELQQILRQHGYSASHATVSRDLLSLKELGGNWERVNGNTYCYPKKSSENEDYKKTIETARKLTQNLIETFEGTPFYYEASGIHAKHHSKHDLSDRIIFMGQPMAQFSLELWLTLRKALSENRIISFEYRARKSENGEYHKHTVQPYQLIFDAGNWNLYGFDFTLNIRDKAAKNKRRLFALSNIKDVTLHEGKDNVFPLPRDFDYRDMVSGTFGCYADEKLQTYKIHFSGYAASFVQDKIWSKNQVITTNEEKGGIEMTFTSNQSKPILNWIMQWAPEAYPIEPPEFVEEWKQRVQKTYETMKNLSNE